jgi:hypothetical protein
MHLVLGGTVYKLPVLKLTPLLLQVKGVGSPSTSNPGTLLDKSRWARVGVLGS